MKKNKKYAIRVIVILAVLACFGCVASLAKPMRVGTTFSPAQCEYLGLDWKNAYLRILDEEFDLIRLGAYWSEIEKQEGVYGLNCKRCF